MDLYDVPEDELPKMEVTPPASEVGAESDPPWDDPDFEAFLSENPAGDLTAARGALFTMGEAKKRFSKRFKA